ncbi:MAG: hypothetical protein Q8O66_00540 [bacterium]|nr:hypothetical protein [bacterium]
MAKNENEKTANEYLASALDLEDRMSLEVYGELLDQNAWPADLDKEVFENIKQLLGIVIEETEMHKKAFSELQKKLSDNSDN